jgi:integrase
MISIGARLGLRVADNLALKWGYLMHIPAGEPFVVIEKKTGKERILSMGSRLREVLDLAITILNPNPEHYIFTSQKGKGFRPMSVQNFNRILSNILTDYRIRYLGNPSSHLLRKSFVVGSIKKGFEDGDHLSLIKVSRLINHSSVSVTLKYTNFETSTALGLYDLK